jgi:hypothetical protein
VRAAAAAGSRRGVRVACGVSIADRFAAVIAADPGRFSGPELLPSRLAAACVAVLPVQAAGVSMIDQLRVPLGASEPTAAAAERLQTTLGDGPCLTGAELAAPLTATAAQIAARWPVYHEHLTALTPYRSVAAIPLPTQPVLTGVIDLYCTDPDGATAIPLPAAAEVARHVTTALLHASDAVTELGVSGPSWLTAPTARRRLQVWQAVGVLTITGDLDTPAALALLRGHAYTTGASLDDTAHDLLAGRLAAAELLP